MVRRGIPLTDVRRTLVDLGQVAGPDELADVVDRALLRRLVTVKALEEELNRLARPGRRGPAALRQSLAGRGFTGGPEPSILEARVRRLLRRWRIPVLGFEVTVLGARYRLDFLLRRDVALEVDGYAYHWSPEDKSADAGRRADLAAAGIIVVEADWILVTRHPEELRRRLLGVLAGPRALGA